MKFQIQLYKFSLENHELIQQSKPYIGRVECLELQIKDDFILFGDLLGSLTILRYNIDENKFQEVNNFLRKMYRLFQNSRLLVMFIHN